MISAALLVPGTCAQQATPQKDQPPTIRQRQKRQPKRIGEGVASGQLTPAETKRLEQDRLSKEICKEKHDQQTAPPKK